MQQRLLFYGAASVVKLAREVATTWRIGHTTVQQRQAQPRGAVQGVALADPPADLAWGKFTAWASPRIGLQADITWSGFQDGYVDAASADRAGLKLQLWWELEPSAQHCDDCPQYAAGSPYDAPGSAASGGNELNATPGDGHTACGASCKCGLRYGWTALSGMGTGLSADNELLLPPNVKPIVPAPPISDWEAQRQAAIAKALQAQHGGAGSTTWPDRDEAIAKAGGVYGLPRPGGPGAQYAPGQIDTTRVETAGGEVSLTRDMVRVTTGDESAEAQALAGLNAGQKAALDQIRGLALLWDATRGTLPGFEMYFDPASASNVWQNPQLAGLDATQRELVTRYFQALGAFADNSPLVDEG
ncbi:MAG: hypothetical protein KGL39_44165 [Patescibacteria group bacterium]|nr:hypothetical protein [Patescibacteria group bacterium]